MGINGGGETDDCMARFDDCITGTKGFCCSACDRRCKSVDSCVGVKPPRYCRESTRMVMIQW